MVAAIGALLVRFKSIGFANVIGKTKSFQGKFGGMAKQVGPQVKKLTRTFQKFGLVASGVLFALTKASPRLAAEFDILAIRINQFLRPFGDELAPLLRIVSDLINELRLFFESLPEPIQDAITFGTGFAVIVGVIVGAIAGLIALFNPLVLFFVQLAIMAAELKLAWETNFLGIRQAAEFLFAGIKWVFDSIVEFIRGIGKQLLGHAEIIIGHFQGIADFFKAVFAGDISGAIDALIKIFQNGFQMIVDIVFWPINAFKELVKAFSGSEFLQGMIDAGQAFIAGFIEGMQEAIAAAGGVITEILKWLGEFFGGSLPERGPLVDIKSMGEELGQTYVMAVGSGIGSSPNSLSRTLSIENLNMGFREEQIETERSFFDGVTEGVRKSTSW